MCKLPENNYSSSQAADVLLTSRDLQTPPLIGPYATLGKLPIDNVDISVSFSEFDQLSNRFCGDNLVAGKLASLDCCASNGGILYFGDRINSTCDDTTVVSADALGTSSELSFTNTSVNAHQLLMARTKQTAKNASESRQPGITNAVKEYTCFVCQ